MSRFASDASWLVAAVVSAVLIQPLVANRPGQAPAPRRIPLDPSAAQSVPVLIEPPETVTMRSGAMVLLPSKEVGEHSTGTNEEAIIVLAGTGEMRISGGATLELGPYVVAYCPPETKHNVVNTGTEPLRYVYVVAKAR